jgi:uncharacterized membrane protein
MTEDKAAPAGGAEDVVVVAAQVADEKGVLAEGAIAAQGAYALIAARFADTDVAKEVYDHLVAAEIAGDFLIEGVLVVKTDENGKMHVQKMTDHSTAKGLFWGAVGGAVAAIFLPATIIGGAVALGVAGAFAGKARNLYHRTEVERELAGVITPGTSGILCLVSATAAAKVAEKMPEAQEVKTVPVDAETAGAVKAAAAAAGDTEAAPAEA